MSFLPWLFLGCVPILPWPWPFFLIFIVPKKFFGPLCLIAALLHGKEIGSLYVIIWGALYYCWPEPEGESLWG